MNKKSISADMFDGEMSEEDNSKENLAVEKEKKVRTVIYNFIGVYLRLVLHTSL